MNVTSSSHCANIQRNDLPFGVLTASATTEQKKVTAEVLADHVIATSAAFPPDYSLAQYKRGLCEQAVSCAVADDDYEDMQEEMVRLTFFAACAK